jgi:hypothetical protein
VSKLLLSKTCKTGAADHQVAHNALTLLCARHAAQRTGELLCCFETCIRALCTLSVEDLRRAARMGKLGQMSVYEERKDELEHFEFMMGRERGRLAVTLDCITDALVLVGQHGVYCQSARQIGKPAMDIQIITKTLTDAKELIASVLDGLKAQNTGGLTNPR